MQIKLEKLLGHASEGKVGRVHIASGDEVQTGDALFDVESSKGNVTVKAPANGTVERVMVAEGAMVNVGDVLAEMGVADAADKGRAGGFSYMMGMLKPEKQTIECDIAIIGGGPGGYVAAIQGAKMGAKVVLIEKEKVGGTCLNWGCIPTKALVRSAEVFRNLKEAEHFGLRTTGVAVDMEKVVARKNSIVEELAGGIEYLLETHGVTLLRGKGSLVSSGVVSVSSPRMETTVNARNVIIATGCRTAQLPIPGIDSPNVLTSTEALDLKQLPRKMVVVGGGVIGMEFAFLFNNLGVDVTVLEYMDHILVTLDRDVSEEITRIATTRGIHIFTGAKVQEIISAEGGECLVAFEHASAVKYVAAEQVLMAVGRKPVTDELGLEALGIEMNANGCGVKVNEKMETSLPRVYAIGDVTNKLQLAHVASHQGVVAVKNIMGESCDMRYDVVPSAIFTDPEIATVGASEAECKAKGLDVVIGKFPLAANGKALTLGERLGFVKLIKERESGRIIGGSILGAHATDLIAEIALAIRNNLTAHAVIETIHAHPTTAEAIHEAALSVEGGALHFHAPASTGSL